MRYKEILESINCCRREGQNIVFKTGCFDILHIGHLATLNFCAQYGAVFVGVGSNETLRMLKGPTRPIVSAEDRMTLISALKCVNQAFILTEPCIGRIDAAEAIAELRPDMWSIPQNDKAYEPKTTLAAKYGVKILEEPTELLKPYSTTMIEYRLRRNNG